MSISISSSLSIASPAANASPNTETAQKIQQPTNNSGDTIRLSASQQVYQLYNQGLTVSQIASSLSLPVDTVNSYLNISGG